MAKCNKVLFNIDQSNDVTEEEKAIARNNIGAQEKLVAGEGVSIDDNVISFSGTSDKPLFSRIMPDNNVILTADDITNGFADMPISLGIESPGIYIDRLIFLIGLFDVHFERNSQNNNVSGVADKLKISVWNDSYKWYSNDNSRGNDPEGVLYDDILASELERSVGFPRLKKYRRLVCIPTNTSIKVRGPSIRFVLNSGAQVGDKIYIEGSAAGIRFNEVE